LHKFVTGHERINEEAKAKKRDAGSSHPTLRAAAELVGVVEGVPEDTGRLVAGVALGVVEGLGAVEVGTDVLDGAEDEGDEEPEEDELPEELAKLGLEPARTLDASTSLDSEPTAFW
jgi:hypothetical protein